MATIPVPFPDSYWVIPARFLAGEYPGTFEMDGAARHKLRAMLRAGITRWIDLTEPGELRAYQPLLVEEARRLEIAIQHTRFPIQDRGVTGQAGMIAILDVIDSSLAAGQAIYVHCWGGIGRTGTVVGCYLVRHGLLGESALVELDRLRRHVPDAWRSSPETNSQFEMILSWKIGM